MPTNGFWCFSSVDESDGIVTSSDFDHLRRRPQDVTRWRFDDDERWVDDNSIMVTTNKGVLALFSQANGQAVEGHSFDWEGVREKESRQSHGTFSNLFSRRWSSEKDSNLVLVPPTGITSFVCNVDDADAAGMEEMFEHMMDDQDADIMQAVGSHVFHDASQVQLSVQPPSAFNDETCSPALTSFPRSDRSSLRSEPQLSARGERPLSARSERPLSARSVTFNEEPSVRTLEPAVSEPKEASQTAASAVAHDDLEIELRRLQAQHEKDVKRAELQEEELNAHRTAMQDLNPTEEAVAHSRLSVQVTELKAHRHHERLAEKLTRSREVWRAEVEELRAQIKPQEAVQEVRKRRTMVQAQLEVEVAKLSHQHSHLEEENSRLIRDKARWHKAELHMEASSQAGNRERETLQAQRAALEEENERLRGEHQNMQELARDIEVSHAELRKERESILVLKEAMHRSEAAVLALGENH
uniref:Uncharacterized protein n=1 Tax=Noctiluca scintillans TaxID=2966 RepID=A0A7S1AHW2_NOCSC